MEQMKLEFDKKKIDLAVAQVRAAAAYVGSLGGFSPDDPMSLVVLRQHLGELKEGLAVLTALVGSLQEMQDMAASRTRR